MYVIRYLVVLVPTCCVILFFLFCSASDEPAYASGTLDAATAGARSGRWQARHARARVSAQFTGVTEPGTTCYIFVFIVMVEVHGFDVQVSTPLGPSFWHGVSAVCEQLYGIPNAPRSLGLLVPNFQRRLSANVVYWQKACVFYAWSL